MQHVVDSRSGQHVGNRDDPPKSAYFAFAGVGRPRRRPRAMLSSRRVASTNAMPPAAKRCRAAATPLQGSLAIPPALVQRRYKLGRSRVHGAAAPEIKEPRLSLRAFNKRPGFLRDAGRSQIADRKDLAPGAGPNSNCLARALHVLLAPSFVVRSPAREALGSSAIERPNRGRILCSRDGLRM
jgi:hypothetical protein